MFNQTTIYALRAMAALSELAPDEVVPLRELTDRAGVPKHYLGKVMRRLVVAGLVRGEKGHGGGFSLLRDPADITFAEILASVDVVPQRGVCVFNWRRCNPERPCALHPAWSRLQETFEQWATTTTLAQASQT
jgi:Rrf2 family protein